MWFSADLNAKSVFTVCYLLKFKWFVCSECVCDSCKRRQTKHGQRVTSSTASETTEWSHWSEKELIIDTDQHFCLSSSIVCTYMWVVDPIQKKKREWNSNLCTLTWKKNCCMLQMFNLFNYIVCASIPRNKYLPNRNSKPTKQQSDCEWNSDGKRQNWITNLFKSDAVDAKIESFHIEIYLKMYIEQYINHT